MRLLGKYGKIVLPDATNKAINAEWFRHVQPVLQIIEHFRGNGNHHVWYCLSDASGNASWFHWEQFTWIHDRYKSEGGANHSNCDYQHEWNVAGIVAHIHCVGVLERLGIGRQIIKAIDSCTNTNKSVKWETQIHGQWKGKLPSHKLAIAPPPIAIIYTARLPMNLANSE